MTINGTSELGFFAEHYAAEYLKAKGYKILGHNYRKPYGEIDVIAEKQGVMVFVEVKANKKDLPGFEPELRVNANKRHRMARIAQTYLLQFKYPEDQPWQLDIISIAFNKEQKTVKIRHYKNIE